MLTLIVLATAALVGGFVVALRTGAMPLGVRGEWEWLRLPANVAVLPLDLALGMVGVAAFAAFAGLGMRSLSARATRAREVAWLAALAGAGVVAQVWVQSAAPTGYGLAKWIVALSQKGSSGYFRIAKDEAGDLGPFLARYPQWIRGQDALHIGTHPPGLVAVEAALLHAVEARPAAARWVEDRAPESLVQAWRVFGRDNPLAPADRATLILIGALTLLACAATVVPLYLLARVSLPPGPAFAAAALWPLLPSAVLFQPTADTAYPLLSTAALALAGHAGLTSASARRARWLAGASGLLLGVGMQFTLAFLAVGVVVGLMLISDQRRPVRDRAGSLVATGAGFLALTLLVWALTRANPFVTWWWNQANHARFYVEFPRTYRAWVAANPVELAVGLGLPTALWAVASLCWPRDVPRASLATAVVLVLLTLGGRSLSEVGRLWLPFMPALVVAAGVTLEKLRAGPVALVAMLGLIGVQTLALQATIQVVYPV